jgi:hypothetical protein
MGVVRIVTGCVLEGRGLIIGRDQASSFHYYVQTVLGPSSQGLFWEAEGSESGVDYCNECRD